MRRNAPATLALLALAASTAPTVVLNPGGAAGSGIYERAEPLLRSASAKRQITRRPGVMQSRRRKLARRGRR